MVRRFPSRAAAAGLVAAAAAIHLASASAAAGGPFADAPDTIGIEGRWAYSRQAAPDAMIDMAATPSAEDADVWLLLACGGNGRLSVALMHTDRFPFELDATSSVRLQSARLSNIAAVAERSRPAQIVLDGTLMAHVMPLLVEEQELAISLTASDRIVHRYTFALQPNEIALAPVRSRCSGD